MKKTNISISADPKKNLYHTILNSEKLDLDRLAVLLEKKDVTEKPVKNIYGVVDKALELLTKRNNPQLQQEKESVDFIFKYVNANKIQQTYNQLLFNFASEGNDSMLDYLLRENKSPIYDFKIISAVANQDSAALENQIDIFDKNPSNTNHPRWSLILAIAVKNGNKDIFKQILEKIPEDIKNKDYIWQSACGHSPKSGSKEMIDLVFKMANKFCPDLSLYATNFFLSAVESQKEEIFDYAMDLHLKQGFGEIRWLEVFLDAVKNFDENMMDKIFKLEEFQFELKTPSANFLERIGNILSDYLQKNDSLATEIFKKIIQNPAIKSLSQNTEINGAIEILVSDDQYQRINNEIKLSPLRVVSKLFQSIIDEDIFKKPSTTPSPSKAFSIDGLEALPREILEKILRAVSTTPAR